MGNVINTGRYIIDKGTTYVLEYSKDGSLDTFKILNGPDPVLIEINPVEIGLVNQDDLDMVAVCLLCDAGMPAIHINGKVLPYRDDDGYYTYIECFDTYKCVTCHEDELEIISRPDNAFGWLRSEWSEMDCFLGAWLVENDYADDRLRELEDLHLDVLLDHYDPEYIDEHPELINRFGGLYNWDLLGLIGWEARCNGLCCYELSNGKYAVIFE